MGNLIFQRRYWLGEFRATSTLLNFPAHVIFRTHWAPILLPNESSPSLFDERQSVPKLKHRPSQTIISDRQISGEQASGGKHVFQEAVRPPWRWKKEEGKGREEDCEDYWGVFQERKRERERERDRGEDSGCIDVSSSRVAFDVHGMMRVPLHESNRGKRKKKKDGSRAECVVEDGWIEENRPVSPMIKAIKPRIGGRAIGSWSRWFSPPLTRS